MSEPEYEQLELDLWRDENPDFCPRCEGPCMFSDSEELEDCE